MIDSKFRTPYQTLIINPLLKQRWMMRMNPHLLTLLGLAIGLFASFMTALHLSFMALLTLALSGFFDTLDGSVARFQNKTSPGGAALDIVSDRIVELALVMGLFFVSPENRGELCLLMLGSILICITSFLVVGIFTQNQSEKSFHYSPGLMERTEAFLFFALMIAFPQIFSWLAILFTLLVTGTGLLRFCRFFLKESNIK